jgi:quercetin dioxygenase-like cupin family protein
MDIPSPATSKIFVPASEPFRWEDIPVLVYKEEGTHFHQITRQILFAGGDDVSCQLRYFEMAPGGYSTFERHQHVHAVMILRGRGQVLVGREIRDVTERDLVYIPPMTWHQFQANRGQWFGFLCLVHCDRDRPQRPDAQEAAQILADPILGPFAKL